MLKKADTKLCNPLVKSCRDIFIGTVHRFETVVALSFFVHKILSIGKRCDYLPSYFYNTRIINNIYKTKRFCEKNQFTHAQNETSYLMANKRYLIIFVVVTFSSSSALSNCRNYTTKRIDVSLGL